MTDRTTLPWLRQGHPHAQIHLPPLTAEEALLLSNLLDRAIAALWRTHGHSMADYLAGLQPDAALSRQPGDSIASAPTESCDHHLF